MNFPSEREKFESRINVKIMSIILPDSIEIFSVKCNPNSIKKINRSERRFRTLTNTIDIDLVSARLGIEETLSAVFI